jgi:hypothetical protein
MFVFSALFCTVELGVWLNCGPSGLVCVDVCVVSCSLVVAVLLTVGCRQFLGIVEAGTWFRYLKKILMFVDLYKIKVF